MACVSGLSKKPVTPRGACEQEERSRQTRILSSGSQRRVAAGMLAAEARVRDELNRVGAQRANGRDDFFGELAFSGVNDECALVAGLHDDVAAVAEQHVDVVANGPDMDVSVARLRVRRLARFRRSAASRRKQFVRFGVVHRAQPRTEFGIHRHAAEQTGSEWQLVAAGELACVWLLAEQVMRHRVRRTIENLLSVVACVEPGAGIDRLPVVVVAADDRLAQEHGIGDDRDVREVIAMPHEELGERCLIALRNTVTTTERPVLHVCGRDDERVPDELARREASECVRRPRGRVRASIHPDDAMPFRCLCPDVDREQALRV